MKILNLVNNKAYEIEPLISDFNRELGNNRDAPNLSFDLVVLMHQLMWSWIYVEIEKGKKLVSKKDFFKTFNVDPNNKISSMVGYCFFCIYNICSTEGECRACPGVWVDDDVKNKCTSVSEKTVYDKLRRFLKDPKEHKPEDLLPYVYEIATIKIRDKKEYDI